jgi:hypothetical protein
MKCTVEMGSGGVIYSQSVMKIFTCVEAILRFCLCNLKRRNFGIIGGSDVRSGR